MDSRVDRTSSAEVDDDRWCQGQSSSCGPTEDATDCFWRTSRTRTHRIDGVKRNGDGVCVGVERHRRNTVDWNIVVRSKLAHAPGDKVINRRTYKHQMLLHNTS